MAEGPYHPHGALVAPARSRPQLWRLLAGLILAMAVAMTLSQVGQVVLAQIAPGLVASEGYEKGNTPGSLLVLLISFGFVIIGVMVAARVLQNRDPLGLIGPLPRAIHQFWQVARILFLVAVVVMILPPYDMGVELNQNLEFKFWLLLLPLSVLAVLIQTAAEEILFRGYIQQSLAARFKSPLIWMLGPAVIFALGHYVPAEAGENALLIAIWSGVFGLVTADLTARSGTLGPAIAVHLFNNLSAILFISLPDSLSGLALYTVPYAMSDTVALREWLIVDFAMMTVGWLAARVAIQR